MYAQFNGQQSNIFFKTLTLVQASYRLPQESSNYQSFISLILIFFLIFQYDALFNLNASSSPSKSNQRAATLQKVLLLKLLYQYRAIMGLTVSESAAERQRVEQLAQKQARKSNRSEMKSQEQSQRSLMHHQAQIMPDRTEADRIKLSETVMKGKEEARQNSQMRPDELGRGGVTVEHSPKILVIPPSEQKPSSLERRVSRFDPPIKQTENIDREPKYLLPIIQKKQPEEKITNNTTTTYRNSQKASSPPKETIEKSPARIGVENLTEIATPIKSNEKMEEHDSAILKSGSRTLTVKKTLQTLSNEPYSHTEPPRNNLDVEFENFDWEIPRSKASQVPNITKKLRPEASVVLISKFSCEETEEQASGEKRKWKNRRELMKEIVNDRLLTADSGFSLPQCLPNRGSGFESVQQLCS